MRNRDHVGKWRSGQLTQQIDQMIAASDQAPRRMRWMYWRYREPRLHDLETRSQVAATA